MSRSGGNGTDMDSHELSDMLAERLGVSGRASKRFLSALADIVEENAEHGRGTRISGICHVRVRRAKARKSRDVSSGRLIVIPEHNAVALTASRRLKNAVREEEAS